MNILFISFSDVPLRGGAGRSFAMLQALSDAGHRVDLLTPHSTEACCGAIRVLGGAGLKALSAVGFRWLVFWTVLRGSYDVVHAVDGAAFFAFRLRRWINTRLVYDAARRIKEPAAGSFLSWMHQWAPKWCEQQEARLLERSDLVFTTCETLTRDLMAIDQELNVAQIEDVPVQSICQGHSLEDDGTLLNWFESRPTYLVMGSCHSMVPGHHRMVLKAARKVLDLVPDAAFVIKSEETVDLENAAASLDIKERCIFITPQAPEAFVRALSLADVVLFVPPVEGGRYVQEDLYSLMNTGAPLVAVRDRGSRGLLSDQNSIPVLLSAESMAEGVLRGIQEPLLAYPLAMEAQKLIADHFSYSSFKYNLRKAYSRMK